jgi:hypothetical protein
MTAHATFEHALLSLSLRSLQRLEADKDDSFLAAKWADGTSLKSALAGSPTLP